MGFITRENTFQRLHINFISNMKTRFRKTMSCTYCHLCASSVCIAVSMRVWVKSVTVSQTTSVRPDRMRTTWTACVRSEQQYDMCSRFFFFSITKNAGRSSQLRALWKGVFEKKKIVKKDYCIIENKHGVAFLCSFSIRGKKNVSRTADFKRHWPINTLVSYRSDMVRPSVIYIYRDYYMIFSYHTSCQPETPISARGPKARGLI